MRGIAWSFPPSLSFGPGPILIFKGSLIVLQRGARVIIYLCRLELAGWFGLLAVLSDYLASASFVWNLLWQVVWNFLSHKLFSLFCLLYHTLLIFHVCWVTSPLICLVHEIHLQVHTDRRVVTCSFGFPRASLWVAADWPWTLSRIVLWWALASLSLCIK